jgi:hypothetical protein
MAIASVSSINMINIPLTTTLNAGEYFIGLQMQRSTTGTNAITTAFASVSNGLVMSLVMNPQQINSSINMIGSTNKAYMDHFFGMTSASSAGTPVSPIAITNLASTSLGIFPVVLMNYPGSLSE